MVANNISCVDHLGNTYESLNEMCRTYHISLAVLKYRFKRGMSLKQALTVKVKSRNTVCYDHLGNRYNSIKSLCCKYGIDKETYFNRFYHGWKLVDILTKPVRVYAEKISD